MKIKKYDTEKYQKIKENQRIDKAKFGKKNKRDIKKEE